MAYKKGKNLKDNADPHINHLYLLKMDISKLPILIADPAQQAEENVYKNKQKRLQKYK